MARQNLMKRVLRETDLEKRTRLWDRKTKKNGTMPAVAAPKVQPLFGALDEEDLAPHVPAFEDLATGT
jgi:hypothetical protein